MKASNLFFVLALALSSCTEEENLKGVNINASSNLSWRDSESDLKNSISGLMTEIMPALEHATSTTQIDTRSELYYFLNSQAVDTNNVNLWLDEIYEYSSDVLSQQDVLGLENVLNDAFEDLTYNPNYFGEPVDYGLPCTQQFLENLWNVAEEFAGCCAESLNPRGCMGVLLLGVAASYVSWGICMYTTYG